jgi:hypothetical protein
VIQHIEAGAGDEAATVWRQHLTFYVAEMLDGPQTVDRASV